jgi:hypothetical protein
MNDRGLDFLGKRDYSAPRTLYEDRAKLRENVYKSFNVGTDHNEKNGLYAHNRLKHIETFRNHVPYTKETFTNGLDRDYQYMDSSRYARNDSNRGFVFR